MGIEERINFYLGDYFLYEKRYNRTEGVPCLTDTSNNTYYICNKRYYENKIAIPTKKELYISSLKNLVQQHNFVGKKIFTIPGDMQSRRLNFFAVSKTRRIDDAKRNYSLVKCFAKERHWKNCYIKDDIEFNNKINIAIWRGATTGEAATDGDGYVLKGRLSNRFLLVEKHFKSNFADVGFSNLDRHYLSLRYKSMVKGRLDIQQLRRYKYIISIEGHDKDSGLNWKLLSNSVVLMAKPIINSWLMEEKLLPNVHYVEILDDLSDLEEKIVWCEKNPHECKNIINNAHMYMKQFLNEEEESIVESQVITRFINKINEYE